MKQSLRAVAAAALLAASGYASAVSVLGIELGNGSFSDQPWAGTIFENIITASGQTLTGNGEITRVNGTNLDTGTLTYNFDNFLVRNFSPSSIDFTGGTINLFVDVSGTQTLFLSLAGHADGTGATFAGTATRGTLDTGSFVVNGSGYFDVVGGAAAAYLNTNGQDFGADLFITSSASPGGPLGVAGSVDARGTVSPIPEPETYALMLAGLVAVGFVARRRRNV